MAHSAVFTRVALFLLSSFMWSCNRQPTHEVAAAAPETPAAASVPAPDSYRHDVVPIEMRNVHLHLEEGIVLDITRLRGEMISRTKGRAPVFDDQRSYVLDIADARVRIDASGLTTLMNRHTFGYDGAPIKDVTVSVADNGRLELKGSMRKGVSVPFSSKATAGATTDGRLQLHVESFKALGVPAKGLLKIFGLELDDLVSLKNRRDVVINDNDIVIAPGEALPPPTIRGHLARVAVVGDGLELSFAHQGPAPARLVPPDPSAPNYVYFGGGDVRFGKLLMSRADLQLIDLDRRDPFDFFPAHYDAQLVAGYSKNTTKQGLKTYMPDHDDLARRRSPLDFVPSAKSPIGSR